MKYILTLLLIVLAIPFLSTEIQAQDLRQQGTVEEAVEPRVVYYSLKTTFQELETLAPNLKGLYCAQIITPDIAARGYFDARTDSVACFNTDAEARRQRDANVPIIRRYAPLALELPVPIHLQTLTLSRQMNTSKPNRIFAASCTGNRGTMFANVGYLNAYADVCAADTTTSVGGVTLRSVWLEGGSCAAINVKMNKYPWPAYQYVNFSSAAYQFLYVLEYTWSTPPGC